MRSGTTATSAGASVGDTAVGAFGVALGPGAGMDADVEAGGSAGDGELVERAAVSAEGMP